MKRLIITGGAGNMGRALRERIGGLAETVLVSDLAETVPLGEGESYRRCDLADAAQVRALVEGADGIVHLGGIAQESRFSAILAANILGTTNLYEAARLAGVRRILFASTNHVTGFHPQDRRLDAASPLRPDGLYAVSKCFGEALARMYHDKFGLESAIVRIGACWPEPTTVRMLSLWLSFDDFAALTRRVFEVPRLGCPVIYAASANASGWWDNSAASALGWRPLDDAEDFRAACEAREAVTPAPPSDRLWQGGRFTDDPVRA